MHDAPEDRGLSLVTDTGVQLWAQGPLPDGVTGNWCGVAVRGPAHTERNPISVAFERADGFPVTTPVFLEVRRTSGGLRASGITFVPAEASRFVIEVVSRTVPENVAIVTLRPLGRLAVSLSLLRHNPSAIGRILLTAARNSPSQARRELSRMALLSGARNYPRDFPLWIEACERPPAPGDSAPFRVVALVYGDPASAPFARTARSAVAQQPPLPCRAAMEGIPENLAAEDYAIILQAGEELAPDYMAGITGELVRLGCPAIVTTDYDAINTEGRRSGPVLNTTPNHTLMLSGVQARGAWAIKASRLAHDPVLSEAGRWAEPVRLESWLACHRDKDRGGTMRLPFILSHRGPGTESAPLPLMERVANDHLAAIGHGMRVRTEAIGRLHALRLVPPAVAGGWPLSVLIPSTLTTPHFRSCLKQVLSLTITPEIEVVVAAGQPNPLDAAQRQVAAEIERDRRVRVVHIPMESFNYSAVNNRAAALTRHPLLLLLNDDVEPIALGWLDHLIALLDDPAVGIVGPRLLYPSGLVQHGGVLLGLNMICEHASRGLPAEAPGHEAQVLLDQQMSAVTGACLLVRRETFDAVGGLDEGYPSAFNDIDFCLRAEEAGWETVYAGSIALTHHELQTYGSHYSGERSASQANEVARFRQRWARQIAADRFHNPNLGLTAGTEWDLAYPPRLRQWRTAEGRSDFSGQVSAD